MTDAAELQQEESRLLCYIEGEPWPEAIDRLRSWQRELTRLRTWAVGAPEFVDTVIGGDHTVGVLLPLLPALDRHGQPNPLEVERRLLADVEALVSSAERLTAEDGIELAFELNGTVVGWIELGEADPMLTEGLLAPWRARVAEV